MRRLPKFNQVKIILYRIIETNLDSEFEWIFTRSNFQYPQIMNKSALLLFSLFQVGSLGSHGAKIEVPKDFHSIGQALEQAKEGDLVVVSPGTYFERIKIPNGVTLRSAGNDEKGKIGLKRAELVILDGKGESSEDAGIELGEGSVVNGISVTGMGKYDGDSWNKHFQTFIFSKISITWFCFSNY